MLRAPARDPRELQAGLPDPVAGWILQCLDREPAARFSTIVALRQAWKRAIGDRAEPGAAGHSQARRRNRVTPRGQAVQAADDPVRCHLRPLRATALDFDRMPRS